MLTTARPLLNISALHHAQVLRRVEEAKKMMEEEMMAELARRKEEQLQEAAKKEVKLIVSSYCITHISTHISYTIMPNLLCSVYL